MHPVTERESYAETDALLRAAVDCALASDDFTTALSRFRAALPGAAPTLMRQMPSGDEALRAIAFAVFRDIWKVLPRPERGWRPLPAPKTERNALCPCGSGRKFKQCCGASAGPSPFDEGLSVLGYVLERLPANEFARLPFKLLSPEEVAHVASEWLEQGRHDAAVALLEPMLADAAALDARHETAFDALCDAYLDQDRGEKRAALVESLLHAPDRELRSAAMHRRCTMFADEGDYAAAWQLFREAQRADPDNPSLGNLELVLLANQGEMEQLAVRARFWAARMRKLGFKGEEVVDFFDDVADNPEAFAQAVARHAAATPDAEALARLAGLVEALPEPAGRYRLRPQDDSAGPLEPEAELAGLEREWKQHVHFGETDVWSDPAWIAWLAAHPLAWQSFAVLEDVSLALDLYPADNAEEDGLIEDVEDALLGHAIALLHLAIAQHRADGLKLEWGWLENRAALSLLDRRIDIAAGTDDELPLLEWMVLTLNPDDNLGRREHLVHVYAASGRPADALAVCDRYADDAMGAMLYGRVLALVLLDRRGEATAALVQAKKLSPRILKTLTAAHPKTPAMRPGGVTVGGEDEAWQYRMRWQYVWEATGAMAWLKQAVGIGGGK